MIKSCHERLQSGYLLLGQSRSQNDLFIAHPHFPHLPGYLLVPLGTALGQALYTTLGQALCMTLSTPLLQAFFDSSKHGIQRVTILTQSFVVSMTLLF